MKELSLMPEREDSGNIARAIDRLFQRPLAEFTAARNELANRRRVHRRRPRAAEAQCARLGRQSVLWRERKVYDGLVRASDRLRAAHTRAIGGGKIDLAALELQHQAAVKKAAEAIRAILAHSGDPATPATMAAVIDTLQALPGGGTPGHLSRPLAPLGFGALGALMKGAATPKTLAEVITFAPAKPKADERAEAERQARIDAGKRLKQVDVQLAASARLWRRNARPCSAPNGRMPAEQLQKASAALAAQRAEAAQLDRDRRGLEEEHARLRDSV